MNSTAIGSKQRFIKISSFVVERRASQHANLTGVRLVGLGEKARLERTDLSEISTRLMRLGGEYHSAGRYYQGISYLRAEAFDKALDVFNDLGETAPAFRSRSISSIAHIHSKRGNLDEAVKGYFRAAKLADACGEFYAFAEASRSLANLKGASGDHSAALETFNRLEPLYRHLGKQHITIYLTFLNSVAVELLAQGHAREAAHISAFVCSFPEARAYPEYMETLFDTLQALYLKAERSPVTVPGRTGDVLPFRLGLKLRHNWLKIILNLETLFEDPITGKGIKKVMRCINLLMKRAVKAGTSRPNELVITLDREPLFDDSIADEGIRSVLVLVESLIRSC